MCLEVGLRRGRSTGANLGAIVSTTSSGMAKKMLLTFERQGVGFDDRYSLPR